MLRKKLVVLSGFVLGFAPLVVLAQVTGLTPTACSVATGLTGNITNLQGLLCKFSELLNAIIPVLIALGVLYFLWGVVSYVIADEEEAKKKGRDRMIFGIIGLVVIVGLWGLVKIVTNTFGIQNIQNITLPTSPY